MCTAGSYNTADTVTELDVTTVAESWAGDETVTMLAVHPTDNVATESFTYTESGNVAPSFVSFH